MKRQDFAAKAAAEQGARAALENWTPERLQSDDAARQLVASWGVEIATAQRLIAAARSRHRG